ncbi:MAG: hypothetical protein AAB815_03075, partial [Patescibacteria group bacterium]
WAGNNDNTPMKKGGVAMAGPIWNKFMNEALKIMPNEKFEKSNWDADPEKTKPVLRGFWQGNENFFIDKISGKLATANTPPETKQEKIVTNVHTILYWVDRSDILGEPPKNPSDDSQFNHWEVPVQNWWAQNKARYTTTTWSEKPVAEDDVHTDSFKPNVSILEPSKNKIYSPDQKIQLKISSLGRFPLQKIDIFVNDIYLGTSKPPFVFSFIPSELENLTTENELKIISYDTAYNRAETSLVFSVE